MIRLHNLKVYKGARKRRKVIGRGLGSGHGTYSTRGAKGQKARKSGRVRPGFEGGRQPLIRQLPKLRGFKSRNPKFFAINIAKLNKFSDGEIVTLESLKRLKIISGDIAVKILSGGKLARKLEVRVPVSGSARAAIEQVGGKVA